MYGSGAADSIQVVCKNEMDIMALWGAIGGSDKNA